MAFCKKITEGGFRGLYGVVHFSLRFMRLRFVIFLLGRQRKATREMGHLMSVFTLRLISREFRKAKLKKRNSLSADYASFIEQTFYNPGKIFLHYCSACNGSETT